MDKFKILHNVPTWGTRVAQAIIPSKEKVAGVLMIGSTMIPSDSFGQSLLELEEDIQTEEVAQEKKAQAKQAAEDKKKEVQAKVVQYLSELLAKEGLCLHIHAIQDSVANFSEILNYDPSGHLPTFESYDRRFDSLQIAMNKLLAESEQQAKDYNAVINPINIQTQGLKSEIASMERNINKASDAFYNHATLLLIKLAQRAQNQDTGAKKRLEKYPPVIKQIADKMDSLTKEKNEMVSPIGFEPNISDIDKLDKMELCEGQREEYISLAKAMKLQGQKKDIAEETSEKLDEANQNFTKIENKLNITDLYPIVKIGRDSVKIKKGRDVIKNLIADENGYKKVFKEFKLTKQNLLRAIGKDSNKERQLKEELAVLIARLRIYEAQTGKELTEKAKTKSSN